MITKNYTANSLVNTHIIIIWIAIYKRAYTNKQLLDEAEHDIMNYQNRGLCYLQQTRGFDNS